MNENEFIKQLQKRAQDQEALLSHIPLSGIFMKVSSWLGKHPWRLLIPLAFGISLLLRGIYGSSYSDLILKIFRGL
jgi:hypothetical protein